MPNYNNYSISNGKGKLYLKSPEPKEGYEKVTYGTNGENITYQQKTVKNYSFWKLLSLMVRTITKFQSR